MRGPEFNLEQLRDQEERAADHAEKMLRRQQRIEAIKDGRRGIAGRFLGYLARRYTPMIEHDRNEIQGILREKIAIGISERTGQWPVSDEEVEEGVQSYAVEPGPPIVHLEIADNLALEQAIQPDIIVD